LANVSGVPSPRESPNACPVRYAENVALGA